MQIIFHCYCVSLSHPWSKRKTSCCMVHGQPEDSLSGLVLEYYSRGMYTFFIFIYFFSFSFFESVGLLPYSLPCLPYTMFQPPSELKGLALAASSCHVGFHNLVPCYNVHYTLVMQWECFAFMQTAFPLTFSVFMKLCTFRLYCRLFLL